MLSSFWICHKCVCCQCRATAACGTWQCRYRAWLAGRMCSPHKAWDLLQLLYVLQLRQFHKSLASLLGDNRRWQTARGARVPQSAVIWHSPNPLHTCSRGLLSRCAHTCYASRGDRWSHIWRSYCSLVRYSDNTCEALVEYLAESLKDLLFHVSCVTDVVGSTHQNIILAPGALKIDFKRRFGRLFLRLPT